MSSKKWALLEKLKTSMTKPDDLTSGFMTVVAERVEAAISSSSKESLDMLNSQLYELYNLMLRCSPEGVQKALRDPNPQGRTESAAFRVGQIGFAQLLVAQTLERRVDDGFINTLQDYRYKKLISELSIEPLSNSELARRLQLTPESISRKLKDLRELGITDFRREGQLVINFLMPSAKALIENLATKKIEDPVILGRVDRLRDDTSSEFKSHQALSKAA